MIHRISFCFIFLYSFICFSQEHIIGGILADTNNDVIAYANVLLIDSEGIIPTIGATTNESGIFIIEDIKTSSYILKISYLGFKSYSKNILIDNNIELGVIYLEEDIEELEGVTIIAKRPTVNRLVDRLVFNVENSTLSNNNVLDVLKHTPGVIVHDGEISVKQSKPIIYINDKRVHLSDKEVTQLLEATSASNIKSIEVITNPPAKYDAEGGAVINIITSKNLVSGYRGSVFGDYKQGSEYPKYSLGTSHFFKTKKLNTYLNYNISPRKDFRNKKDIVNFIENSQKVSSWNTDYYRTRKTTNQNINANIDYDINDRNTLSFSTSMLLAPREGVRNDVNSITEVFGADRILDSIFNTMNQSVDETYNLAFTLDYALKLKKEGENIAFNVHHTNYDYSMFQDVDTDYDFPDGTLIRNNRFQTFSSQKVNLYTGQTDYSLPLDTNSNFEAGLKFSKIDSEGKLTQYLVENNEAIEDVNNSDVFVYKESNYAVYSSYSKDWDVWSLKLGLRGEFTSLLGNSLSTGTNNKNDYFKVFPSFYLLHNLNENNQIYFNYNRRIYRPKYNELNPFDYFINDNTIYSGNPNLLPQIDDQFILGYTFNENFTFEAYYRYEDNPNIELIFQDNDNKVIRHNYINIDSGASYGLDFTTYITVKNNWSLYVLTSLSNNRNSFSDPESNIILSREKWTFYGQFINYFSFLSDKSLTADLSIIYISPYFIGPRVIGTRSGVDFIMRKTLWSNRASISAGVTDIFNTQNYSTEIKYLNQDIFSDSSMENRLFTLGFVYKFGNFRLKDNKKNLKAKERDRLMLNQN